MMSIRNSGIKLNRLLYMYYID